MQWPLNFLAGTWGGGDPGTGLWDGGGGLPTAHVLSLSPTSHPDADALLLPFFYLRPFFLPLLPFSLPHASPSLRPSHSSVPGAERHRHFLPRSHVPQARHPNCASLLCAADLRPGKVLPMGPGRLMVPQRDPSRGNRD